MNLTKTCSKCDISKPLDEFHKGKGGKYGRRSDCIECNNKKSINYYRNHREESEERAKKYYQNHREKISKQSKIRYENGGRESQGHISMHKNKLCSAYLGIVIGERLIRHLFKNVKVMPHGNPKFDFICGKDFKIDVKTACITLNRGYPQWTFGINHNTIADFFIFVAFDNRTYLNPLHLFMIPGNEINNQGSISSTPSRIHKWDKWKRDIKDAQLCCFEMKNEQTER